MHFRFCCILIQMMMSLEAMYIYWLINRARSSWILHHLTALMSDRQKLCKHAYMEACSLCRFGADLEMQTFTA